jgi:hypothetical protein
MKDQVSHPYKTRGTILTTNYLLKLRLEVAGFYETLITLPNYTASHSSGQ